jgi:hypothetical protein
MYVFTIPPWPFWETMELVACYLPPLSCSTGSSLASPCIQVSDNPPGIVPRFCSCVVCCVWRFLRISFVVSGLVSDKYSLFCSTLWRLFAPPRIAPFPEDLQRDCISLCDIVSLLPLCHWIRFWSIFSYIFILGFCVLLRILYNKVIGRTVPRSNSSRCFFYILYFLPLHVSALVGHLQAEFTIILLSYLIQDPLFCVIGLAYCVFWQILPLSFLIWVCELSKLGQITSLLNVKTLKR